MMVNSNGVTANEVQNTAG